MFGLTPVSIFQPVDKPYSKQINPLSREVTNEDVELTLLAKLRIQRHWTSRNAEKDLQQSDAWLAKVQFEIQRRRSLGSALR